VTAVATDERNRALPAYSLFGAALAFAGPPIYIHVPNLYASQHNLTLATVGAVLLGVRLLDFVQDPLLAWWIGRHSAVGGLAARQRLVGGSAVLLSLSALALFAPPPLPAPPAGWLALSLAAVFTGFSALQILYYSSGVRLGEVLAGGHEQLAGWREAGILVGVSAACITPSLAGLAVGDVLAFPVYALAFVLLLTIAAWRMRPWWPSASSENANDGVAGFCQLLADKGIRRLLVIGLVNALPVGLTATLFVFFVEDRLEAADHVGPLLLIFFVAAAIAAPLWARAAHRFGTKRAMLFGMSASILIFAWVLALGSGDVATFYMISALSGATLGADMTLLPAMLSTRLARRRLGCDEAFGLWGFINKASLALAAGFALPALDATGFVPGAANDAAALKALSLAYAGVPCLLKAVAATALLLTRVDESEGE